MFVQVSRRQRERWIISQIIFTDRISSNTWSTRATEIDACRDNNFYELPPDEWHEQDIIAGHPATRLDESLSRKISQQFDTNPILSHFLNYRSAIINV